MDPITCAARQFLEEVETAWEMKPTSGSGSARVVRVVVSDGDRGELVKALRLAEAAPENRRPLFLIETPFTDVDGYFARVGDRIAEDYELLRRGAAEEGVDLPPFLGEHGHRDSLVRATSAMEQAARKLEGKLDGVVIAFVPARVHDDARWQWSLTSLVNAGLSARIRIVMTDRRGGPLAGLTGAPDVGFAIDREKMTAYTRKLVAGARSRSAPGVHPGVELYRALALQLRNAADYMNEGNAAGAAATYQRAIAGCTSSEQAGAESCAWLGLAAAHVMLGNSPAARSSYLMAANAAERAGLPALKDVALRMTGVPTATSG